MAAGAKEKNEKKEKVGESYVEILLVRLGGGGGGYVRTAAIFLPTILSRSSKPRSSSLRKDSERLVGAPLLRATLTVSRPSGEKPVWAEGESWSVRWSPKMI